MAHLVFNSCLEIFPDCERGFLTTLIRRLTVDFGITNDAHGIPLEQIPVPPEMVAEFTNLTTEYLLTNGYERVADDPIHEVFEVNEPPPYRVGQFDWVCL